MDVTELSDRSEISEVLTRYAVALDTKDWDQLRSCFTDDAVLDYEGVIHDYPQFETRARTMTDRVGVTTTHHVVTNQRMLVRNDVAGTMSYVVAQHVRPTPDGRELITTGGRYDDDLLRTPSGWRIRHRHYRGMWQRGRF